jgi:thioredoxin reductase (NADPH)
MIAKGATRLRCGRKPYATEIGKGIRVQARAIVIVTGAQYRRLLLDDLSKFEGAGVFYGATFVEAELCDGEDVIVVGGGNSADQATVFLAQSVRRVHLIVRAPGLAETMSSYLIPRIEENPAITFHPCTEIVRLSGDEQLARVTLRNNLTGKVKTDDIGHIRQCVSGLREFAIAISIFLRAKVRANAVPTRILRTMWIGELICDSAIG